MSISIAEKRIADIKLIKPLWEQLNSIHFEKSVYFKKRFESYTFDKRMESIIKKSKDGIIKLDVLFDDGVGSYVGYCLSSIEDELGEIESIFIEKSYREFGLGGKLMESALRWFEINNISNIKINVVYANDNVFSFYSKYGFKVSNYILSNNSIINTESQLK